MIVLTQVLAEIAVMHQIHHSNLLSFVAAVDEGHRINVIMDWAGDCLREHRSLLYPQHYSEELVRLIMYQMTHALTYLHHKVSSGVQEMQGDATVEKSLAPVGQ